MPLPLTVLPFWYRLTWAVPDEGPLNGCVYTELKLNSTTRGLTGPDRTGPDLGLVGSGPVGPGRARGAR